MAKIVIMAYRSSQSCMGQATAPLKQDGKVRTFDTFLEATTVARTLNQNTRSPNVFFCPETI